MIVDFQQVVSEPVEPVFALMADIARRPDWVTPAAEREELPDDIVGVGSRYRAVGKCPGLLAECVHEITAYEPNQLLGESWDGPLRGTNCRALSDGQHYRDGEVHGTHRRRPDRSRE